MINKCCETETGSMKKKKKKFHMFKLVLMHPSNFYFFVETRSD